MTLCGKIFSGAEKDFSVGNFFGDAASAMPLLLIGDECAAMIEKYLSRSSLFACFALDGKVCGIGCALVEHVCRHARERGAAAVEVGTGTGTVNVGFYEKCGFSGNRTVRGFFTRNYPQPIVEDGIILRDMLILRCDFSRGKTAAGT